MTERQQMLKRPPHILVTTWRRVRGLRVRSNFVRFRAGREALDRLHERTEWSG
jgi:hypothetical protein